MYYFTVPKLLNSCAYVGNTEWSCDVDIWNAKGEKSLGFYQMHLSISSHCFLESPFEILNRFHSSVVILANLSAVGLVEISSEACFRSVRESIKWQNPPK